MDHRKLKTPKGKTFEVSSEPLAYAVALEWESQKETINRSNMHFVRNKIKLNYILIYYVHQQEQCYQLVQNYA